MPELLLVLLILAQIVTFTIPKVLQAQERSARNTVLKETFAMLQSVVYTGVLAGEIVDDGSGDYNGDYILSRVNAVKICHGNSQLQGCWDNTYSLPNASNRGFVLPSGAVVVGSAMNPSTSAPHISIDWNGTKGPNVVGEDQLRLVVCYQTTGNCNHGGHIVRPTQIAPYQAASQTMFYELFER